MKPFKHVRPNGEVFKLSLFCGKIGEAWKVMAWPSWLPGFLRNCFDAKGEAFPVYLDLEELDRQMENSGVEYQKIESPIGGVELTAHGAAATVLAVWLSKSFASGVQPLSAGSEKPGTKHQGMAG